MTSKVLVANEENLSEKLNLAFKEGFVPSLQMPPHPLNSAGDISITVQDDNFPEFAKDVIAPWFVLSTSLAHVNELIDRQDDRGYRLFFSPIHKPTHEDDSVAQGDANHTRVVLVFIKEEVGPGKLDNESFNEKTDYRFSDDAARWADGITPALAEFGSGIDTNISHSDFTPPADENPKPFEDVSVAEPITQTASESSSATVDEQTSLSEITSGTEADGAEAQDEE